jgi:hypothetical protein
VARATATRFACRAGVERNCQLARHSPATGHS